MSRAEPPKARRSRPKAPRRRCEPVTIRVSTDLRLRVSERDFWRLCTMNPEVDLERGAEGALIAMAPAGSDTGRRNLDLCGQLWAWNRAADLGVAFDSSAGFTLPSSAVKGPDASWMSRARWDALDPEDRRGFAHVAPDFVAELTSPSDQRRRADVRRKMREYVEQGVRLAWLIDPASGEVEIHRPGRPVETLSRPATLLGEDVLPGLVLDLRGILFD